MGFSPVKRGLLTALMAALMSMFVMASAVDAAVCAPETSSSHAAELAIDGPAESETGETDGNHLFCSHGHCHHGGVAIVEGHETESGVPERAPTAVRFQTDPLTSQTPSGLDRPPQG